METTEDSQEKSFSHDENATVSINEDDFEVISEDEDKTMRENVEQIKTDLETLVQEKVKVIQEKEEIAQAFRKNEQISAGLLLQLDWIFKANKCLINRQDIWPVVPESLSEESRGQLNDIQNELSNILQSLRESGTKDKAEAKHEILDIAELDFYRQINQFLITEEDEHQVNVSEFPEVPAHLPESVQIYLQRYKTIIKHMVQEAKSGSSQVDNDKWTGDSISSSFMKVEMQVETKNTEDSEIGDNLRTTKQETQQTQANLVELEPGKNDAMDTTSNTTENDSQNKILIETYEERIHKLEQRIKATEAEKERALTENDNQKETYEERIHKLEQQIKVIEAEKERALTENDNQNKILVETYEERINKLEQQIKVTEAEKERALTENDNQNKILAETYEERINKLEQQIKVTEAEKERALRRLSEIAGSQLTDNNPALTDLNDINRPLNIGENFKELYDNEWTDAICILTSKMNRSEEEAIQNLLEILQQISIECQFVALEQQSQLLDVFKPKEGQTSQSSEQKTHLSKQDFKKLKEFQKSMAPSYVKQLEQIIMSGEAFKGPFRKEAELCDQYIRKCIQLCWMMFVQDPPMELIFEFYPGQTLDDQQLKTYRKSGTNIHYLVWPMLLLHHDGPLVQKGIAQPY